MNFEESKNNLNNLIIAEEYDKAKEFAFDLLSNTNKLDSELMFLLSIIADYEGLYGIARYYLERAYNINPENQDIVNSLLAFSNGSFEKLYPNNFFSLDNRLNILIITGIYKSVDVYLNEFVMTYKLLGHNVYILHFNQETILEDYKKLDGINIDFIISHIGTYKGFIVNGIPLAQKFNCKIANILLDNPIFTMELVKEELSRNNFYQLTVDREHIKYLNANPNVKCNIGFLPHGGTALNRKNKPLSNRSISVAYFGTAKVREKSSNQIEGLCADAMIENPNIDSFSISKLFADKFLEFDDSNLDSWNIIDKLSSNELYALGYYRTLMVKVLVENGIKVDVYGSGWDQLDFIDNDNFILHDSISPKECIELMYDTKIVLNSMPWFKDGTHERIFNSMFAGAISVSDYSTYLDEIFINGEEIFLFNLEKMDDLVKIVKSILDNPDKFQSVADKAYRKVVSRDSWSHRALELLDILGYVNE